MSAVLPARCLQPGRSRDINLGPHPGPAPAGQADIKSAEERPGRDGPATAYPGGGDPKREGSQDASLGADLQDED